MFSRCLRAVNTGCYFDFCFFGVCGGQADAVAIIDAVVCHHPPPKEERFGDTMDAELAWADHRHDSVFFENEGVPTTVYWWRKPHYMGGVLLDKSSSGSPI